MGNGAAYLIAVLIAIVYTYRKVDVRRYAAEQFPHVPRSEFESWQSRELGAYNLITGACALMIVVDYAWRWYFTRGGVSFGAVRAVGAGIFLGWMIGVGWGLWRLRSARRRRAELGIGPAPAVRS